MMPKLAALLAVAVVLAFAGCTASQQQRAKSTADDALLAAQVRARIAAIDPATVSLVKVDVLDRKVTLSGQVRSEQERAQIDRAARGVSGIRSLDDRLRINPKAPTASELAYDLELQARVQAAIAAQTGVNALKVGVVVHNKVVTLNGTAASPTVRALILETVRGVPGVKRVVDRLRVQR